MMHCRACGKQLHESAKFCPQCGYQFESAVLEKPSIWMALTSLMLSILTLLALLSVVSDLETLNMLSRIESSFGSHTLKKRFIEEVMNNIVGGITLGLPATILGCISLMQQRGGRAMSITSLVIAGLNLFLIIGLFGLTLK